MTPPTRIPTVKPLPTETRVELRTLADDRNLRGTTAFRLCQAATAAETRPGWSGTGLHYTAWLNALALGQTPSSPEAALGSSAP